MEDSQCNHSGRYTIIFNGEIYNHQEIEKNSIKWSSYTDTETLIESIEYFGLEQTLKNRRCLLLPCMIKKINFPMSETNRQKPLYYGNINNKFFASELKAFKAIKGLELKINRNSLSSFIKSGYIECPNSIYEKIIS